MSRLQESVGISLKVLKLQAGSLLLLTLIQMGCSGLAEQLQNQFVQSGADHPLQMAWILFFSIATELLIGTSALALIVRTAQFIRENPTLKPTPSAAPDIEMLNPSLNESEAAQMAPPTLPQILGDFINPLLIEGTRTLARVIFALPFFILPALFVYLRYSFVAFVVLLDPTYQMGGKDALRASVDTLSFSWLSSAKALLIAVVLPLILSTVASVLLPSTSMEDGAAIGVKILSLLFEGALHLALTLFSSCYLFLFYHWASDQLSNRPVTSPATPSR